MNPTFGVGQLPEKRSEVLRAITQSLEFPLIDVLEIGSYEGGSALTISHAIGDAGKWGTVTCVDTWKPYLFSHQSVAAENMDKDLTSGAAFERFLANIKLHHHQCPIAYFKGDIESFLEAEGKGCKYHLIFIDGSHRYADVLKDLTLASPLLEPGGIICGDDLEMHADQVPAEELLNVDSDFNGRYHPGVTRAVWEFFGGRVWVREAVWAVRKGFYWKWEEFNALS